METLKQTLDRMDREAYQRGKWVPANNGTETPFFTRNGHHLLYCYHTITRKHAYIDLGTDMPLGDEEARLALGTY